MMVNAPGGDHDPPASALVINYACLFTHDLKRKQKRWRDGRLQFHTFNKRVMVYDEGGNFIGDSHWHEDYEFGEDEELNLDRGGVIVQVAERRSEREQDLTELFARKPKDSTDRPPQPRAQTRPTSTSEPTSQTPISRTPSTPGNFRPLHVPLRSIVTNSTTPLGRAVVPSKSPYEERGRQSTTSRAAEREEPPRKKRAIDYSSSNKTPYSRSLFGAPLTLSSQPASSLAISDQALQLVDLTGQENTQAGGGSRPTHHYIQSRGQSNITLVEKISNAPVSNNRPTQLQNETRSRQPPQYKKDKSFTASYEESITLSRQDSNDPTPPSRNPLSRLEPVVPEPHVPVRKKTGATQRVPDVPPTKENLQRTCEPSTLDLPTEPRKPIRKPDSLSTTLLRPIARPNQVSVIAEEKAQPKTELRIKSRRKRGLLLMSEKLVSTGVSIGVAAHKPVADDIVHNSSPLSSIPKLDHGEMLHRRTEESHDQVVQPPKDRAVKSPKHQAVEPTQVVLAVGEDRDQQPRPPELACPPLHQPPEPGRKASDERPATKPESPTLPPEPPRVQNPATRGRKAALKSHAAGQMPRSVIGPENRPILRQPEVQAPKDTPSRPQGDRVGQPLSGFTKASGGPWSRCAHDLFDYTKPG